MKRFIIMGLMATALGTAVSVQAQAGETITIYQDPNCGCCSGWAQYMRAEGFDVREVQSADLAAIKTRLNVPMQLASCHTAQLESSGQIVEGHVPTAVVRKLLASKDTRGVSAPGMPGNAPGMGPMDGNLMTYDFNAMPFSRD
ncbi:MAG: DUF411 domain-containing protein [Castellaniella sp.]|uniref:DUF411 domain-containing protein n=1 Tax=Castellaniella sp. TaxID=1955812 RepID=UPI003A8741BF